MYILLNIFLSVPINYHNFVEWHSHSFRFGSVRFLGASRAFSFFISCAVWLLSLLAVVGLAYKQVFPQPNPSQPVSWHFSTLSHFKHFN